MQLGINISSGVPIYKQIYEQIKTGILNDSYKVGELLPSIRLLAKDLRISVITTKRAYDELERYGYIYTILGKGSFVAEKDLEMVRENLLTEIEGLMEKIISLAVSAEISNDKLTEMFKVKITNKGGEDERI